MSPTHHLIELGYVDPWEVEQERQALRRRHADALSRAVAWLDEGRTTEARIILDELQSAAPDWTEPRRRLAQACYLQGQDVEALQHLHWLECRGVEHAELALLRGAIELRRRRWDDALASAHYARALHQPLPAAHVLAAQVRFRRGQWDEAERELADAERESQIAAPRADVLALRAALALRRGQWEEAADWALQSLEVDFAQPVVHLRLGIALWRSGRCDEARQALACAAAAAPTLAAPGYWLARIAAERGDESARRQARQQARAAILRRRAGRAKPDG